MSPKLPGLTRSCQVQEEHLSIDTDLLGRELASPWRRGVGIMADLFIGSFFVIPWLTLCTFVAIYAQAPSIPAYVMVIWDAETPKQQKEELAAKAWPEFAMLIAKQRPELLPPDGVEMATRQEYEPLAELLFNESKLDISLSRTDRSFYDRRTDTYVLGGDIVFGPAIKAFGTLSGFLLYLTLFTWLMKGRTPGKWLVGCRIVRLDAGRLGLWDCFGRAGGYSASISTFGLGFLEAFWQPNAQTIHDRISGTVVLRWPRFSRSRPFESAAQAIDQVPEDAD